LLIAASGDLAWRALRAGAVGSGAEVLVVPTLADRWRKLGLRMECNLPHAPNFGFSPPGLFL